MNVGSRALCPARPPPTCDHPGLVEWVHGETPDAGPCRVAVTGDGQLEAHVPARHGAAARACGEKRRRDLCRLRIGGEPRQGDAQPSWPLRKEALLSGSCPPTPQFQTAP